MGYTYEAAVVSADRDSLVKLLDALAGCSSLAEFDAELKALGDEAYAVFVTPRCFSNDHRQPDPDPPYANDEVETLACELSRRYGEALAVHYDDSMDRELATLYRAGEVVRGYGDADEIWVLYGDDGSLLDEPRYPGDALPADFDGDLLRNATDAALESSGMADRLTAAMILDAYASDDAPLWFRGPA